jgi:aryl-alcohol dehydrogenase-like predicted oxidoreductase
MKYRQLGKTGVEVSEISLGCSGFWGNHRFSERKALSVVHAAFECGINFFDTGHNYSNYNAEPRLGKAIEEILRLHPRTKIVVSTKAGTVRSKATILPFTNPQHTNFSPDYIEQACAQSIRNLNCGYIDVFQLHGVPASQLTDELLTRLASMKRRGMYRILGINTHKEADMKFVLQLGDVFEMVLLDLNVLQLDRLPIIEKLHAAGMGVMAGTVLGQGHLIQGKIGKIARLTDAWYLARAVARREGRQLAKASPAMRKTLASIGEMTAAQAAMAYVLSIPFVTSCVFGTTSISNLQEIVAASGLELSEESKSRIRTTYDSQTLRISA